jgi:hypothetical protein
MTKTQRAAEAIENERRVVELRLVGLTFDRIAEQIGYTDGSAAYKAYQRAIARTVTQPAEELRDVELARLDSLWRVNYRNAMTGDAKATLVCLRISERRARLLGMDAPIKTEMELTAYQGGTDIDREVERLAALLNESAGGSKAAVAATSPA